MPLLPNINYVSTDASRTTVVLYREDGAAIYIHRNHNDKYSQQVATFVHGCHLTASYPPAF